jgi:hypothetical protein
LVSQISLSPAYIFPLLALASFGIAYAATFVLLLITKTPGARLAAGLGLLAAFSLAFIELFLTSGGSGLIVMMPASCVGVIVADVRIKLRDARATEDKESVKGWSMTLRLLMTIFLPLTIIMAMVVGIH